MQTFRNLVSSDALLHEAINLLRMHGGRASVVHVADEILQLPNMETELAAILVAELIKDDWRLRLAEDASQVELLWDDDEGRSLAETDFIVFDVETTGPKTPPCRIMEIGAYRISGGRIVEEFETLLNPQMRIPPFISHLTGITDDMVARAPLFAEVADDWLRFAGEAVLVAHNAAFDVRFINHEISLVYPGRQMVNSQLCTVSLSRRVLPEISNHRLHTLAEHFSIPIVHRHRAACDARATAEVFLRMLERLDHNGVRHLADARRFRLPAAQEMRADAQVARLENP